MIMVAKDSKKIISKEALRASPLFWIGFSLYLVGRQNSFKQKN